MLTCCMNYSQTNLVEVHLYINSDNNCTFNISCSLHFSVCDLLAFVSLLNRCLFHCICLRWNDLSILQRQNALLFFSILFLWRKYHILGFEVLIAAGQLIMTLDLTVQLISQHHVGRSSVMDKTSCLTDTFQNDTRGCAMSGPLQGDGAFFFFIFTFLSSICLKTFSMNIDVVSKTCDFSPRG